MKYSMNLDIYNNKKYKRFFWEKDMMEWGKKYYPPARYNSLDKKEIKDFFYYYTGNADRLINNTLRNTQNFEELFSYGIFTKETYIRALEEMENVLIPENIIVYRKIEKHLFNEMLKWSKVNRLKKGSIIFDKGFLSTTLSYRVCRKVDCLGRNIIATICVPKDTKGIFLENLVEMNEYEILFPPETKLKVLGFSRLFNSIICIIVNDHNSLLLP